MNIKDFAAQVKVLRHDETLVRVISGIEDDAAQVFMNPSSSEEQILESHKAIQAVGILKRAFDAIEADAKLNDRES